MGSFYPPGYEKTQRHQNHHKNHTISLSAKLCKGFTADPHSAPQDEANYGANYGCAGQQASVQKFVEKLGHWQLPPLVRSGSESCILFHYVGGAEQGFFIKGFADQLQAKG